jgi:hypothetical protein
LPRDDANQTPALQTYWLAADAPPIGGATLLLVAAGPLMPAVPAVSFEPERLHPNVPPASAAINTATIALPRTRSIILSSRVVSVGHRASRRRRTRDRFDKSCGRRRLIASQSALKQDA